uniref:Uncharacterized protein n=1 Tax=Neisseria meningitidis alpha275 TaxID=295996 RepID=C6SMY2_NEIME|nr:hypothetical protein predicted by Glimmer/Critica [Neisseria meningitidis alpha275]
MFRLPPAREGRDFRLLFLIFCFCGNNGTLDDVHLSGKQKTLRRHSRESGNLEF